MNSTGKGNTSWLFFIIAGVVLTALDAFRVFHVPITHDEALTVMEYTRLPVGDIVSMAHPSANNHILNTLLTKSFITLFGYGLPAVRLANFVAYIFFLVFSARLCRLLFTTDNLWAGCVFLLLNLNPFLFDFWGLCRGYGLSIALMTGSIYYLLQYSTTRKAIPLWLSLLLALASVWSNLALLNFYLGLLAAILLLHLYRRAKAGTAIIAVLANTILLWLLVSEPVKKLLQAGELYYGGSKNFIADTIHSVVKYSLFSKNGSSLTIIISYAVAVLLVLVVIHSFLLYLKRKKQEPQPGYQLILNVVLLVPVLSVIIQHYLLGTLYLIDRTALFFTILFLLPVTFSAYNRRGKLANTGIAAITILCMANFGLHINLDRTFMWPFNIYEKTALDRMVRNNRDKTKKITLRPYGLYAPPFQYYAFVEHPDAFEPIKYTVADVDTDSAYDYYFVNTRHLSLLSKAYVIDTIYENEYYLLKKAN